jgi:hypothetical protein
MKMIALALPAFALLATNAGHAEDSPPPPEKKICQREIVTGSRVPSKKICRTRAEWQELARINRTAYRTNGETGRPMMRSVDQDNAHAPQ